MRWVAGDDVGYAGETGAERRSEADAKKPPQSSRTAQRPHSSRYSFFQSEMLFRATGQRPRSRTHSWWL